MFNSNMPALSASDIAAVTGNNNDGFGNNNGWWILIILFAIFGGFGRGGYGYGSNCGASDGYVLASDFANIERKIDGVNNGLCDGFYAMNTGMLNGFNATQAAIATGFAGVENAVCNLGYQNAQLINGVNAQLNDCCCQNREAIAQVRYDMATNACATNTNIHQAAQDIMLNCNNNYRQLDARLTDIEMSRKDEKIADLQARLGDANLAASQSRQNEYIINQLRPAPVPAYTVANPYAYTNYGCGCCGQNAC